MPVSLAQDSFPGSGWGFELAFATLDFPQCVELPQPCNLKPDFSKYKISQISTRNGASSPVLNWAGIWSFHLDLGSWTPKA